MCGIAGIVNLENAEPVNKSIIRKMVKCIKHRGPNSNGIFEDNKLSLGSVRLSILDLSESGNQPMLNTNKDVVLAYNGEVYNFYEIRKILESKGYTFRSETDTEVVLNAYIEWGLDSIHKFNGMFSMCIYDKRKSKILLIRDRLGIKPLYYSTLDGKLIFGSEIKVILNYPNFPRKINYSGVSSYLSFRQVLGSKTLYDGIDELLPGNYIEITDGNFKVKEYWDLSTVKVKGIENYGASELRKDVEHAVKKRMVSDVPIGCYLSGGIDSSIISYVMSKHSSSNLKTYSINFENKKFSEEKYYNKIVKKFNLSHTEVILNSEDYLKNMIDLISIKDQPLSVPNEVALYTLTENLSKDITVVLSGEGADEIFYGYSRIFTSPKDYNKLKLPIFIRKIFFKELHKKYGERKFKNRIEHFLYNHSYFTFEEQKSIYSKDFLSIVPNDDLEVKHFSDHFDRVSNLSYEKQISYVFERNQLLGYLSRSDITTMAHSVECRVPFVDHSLVEKVFNLEDNNKIRWISKLSKIKSFFKSSDNIAERDNIVKYILKEAFKEVIPETIIKRDKFAFPIPLDDWFKNDFYNFCKLKLLSHDSKIKSIFDQKKLEKWIDSNSSKESKNGFGQKLWRILNLELWAREFDIEI